MHTNPHVAVIVLNWNGLTVLEPCIESLLNQTYPNFTIFLLDNGSTKQEQETILKQYDNNPKIKLRLLSENLGFSKGNNLILHEILADNKLNLEWIALLNNDTLVHQEWLNDLVKGAISNNCLMAASKILIADQPYLIDNCGLQLLNTSEILPIGAREQELNFQNPTFCLCPSGGAGLYHITLFKELGGFENYFETCYEDAALGLKFALHGHQCIFCPEAVVWHKVSYSVGKTKTPSYGRNLQKNILMTYFSLMPRYFILKNLPLILIRLIALITLSLITWRIPLLTSQWGGIRLFIQDYFVRKKRFPKQFNSNGFKVVKALEQPFIKVYWKYFKQFIASRNATILER